MVLDCEDEVPAADVVTAMDNCEGMLEVSFTEELIGELPAEGSSADCVALTPEAFENGVDCSNHEPWSLVLFDLIDNETERYNTIEANWVEYPDGSATLTGTVASNDNPNAGWEISANFVNGMPWEEWSTQGFPTSFKDDCDLGTGHHLDWMYYIMAAGATLTGFGDYEGSVLTLAHAPSNLYYGYQVGVGANNTNENYGGGGWFTYLGILNGVEVSGAGDFAFDHDCCPQYQIERTWCAIDCAGNESCFTQTISFENLNGLLPQPAPVAFGVSDEEKGNFYFVSIAPNPAVDYTRVEFVSEVVTRVRLEVYDLNGRMVDVLFEGIVTPDLTYRVLLRTQDLESGVYNFRLAALDEVDNLRFIIAK